MSRQQINQYGTEKEPVKQESVLAAHYRAVFIIVILCAAVLGGAAVYGSRICDLNGHRSVVKWELSEKTAYDQERKEMIAELLEQGVDVVFWKENTSDTVKNADYNRSVKVKTIGIAGDVSVLFSGCNHLAAGETGYCLLGEDTAWRLFGSTRVNGRSIQINGITYQVAGVQYQEKELCVYELPADGEEELSSAAVCSSNKGQLDVDKRRVEQAVW